MEVANQRSKPHPCPSRSCGGEKIISRVCSESIAGFPAAMMTDFSWDFMPAWILNIQVIINSAIAQALKLTCSLGSCWPFRQPGTGFPGLARHTFTFASACCFPLGTCSVTGVTGVLSPVYTEFQPHHFFFCTLCSCRVKLKEITRSY